MAASSVYHEQLAAAVRARVVEGPALTDAALRRSIVARGAGGPPVAEPHDALVHQVASESARVTDRQVADVRSAVGSDKAAFEIVMTAAIGAGLMRLDAALQALREAADAPR